MFVTFALYLFFCKKERIKNRIFNNLKPGKMKMILKDVAGICKILIGTLAVFLILFGIHWVAILAGIVLGALYFIIPKRHLY